jgi:hypothetical protein
MWNDLLYLLSIYGSKLDVVYCEKEFCNVAVKGDGKVFFGVRQGENIFYFVLVELLDFRWGGTKNMGGWLVCL